MKEVPDSLFGWPELASSRPREKRQLMVNGTRALLDIIRVYRGWIQQQTSLKTLMKRLEKLIFV